MKRIFSFLVCLFILCALTVPAFADDETGSALDSGDFVTDGYSGTVTETVTTESDGGNITVNVTLPASTSVEETVVDAPEEDCGSESSSVSTRYTTRTLDVSSSASAVSYTLMPVNCQPEYLTWFFSDGRFIVTLTDAWFEEWFPDVDKASVLAGMAAYPHSFTVNGSSFTDYSLDCSDGSVIFPYIEDGLYVLHSDAGFRLDMDISSTAVPGFSSGSSLISAVKALFGSYTPRTQTVTEYLSDGSAVSYTEVVPGLAGLDYEWLASVALFALVLYCILRMIGGALKWS